MQDGCDALVESTMLESTSSSSSSSSKRDSLQDALERLLQRENEELILIALPERNGTEDEAGAIEEKEKTGIRFIKQRSLCGRDTFPRNPECAHLCVDLCDIDRSKSFLVFISHMWLGGWSGSGEWRGKPHPDTRYDAKFRVCEHAIPALKNRLARNMDECYVWLDFSCINQDTDPCDELKHLDKIIGACDVVLTPIPTDTFLVCKEGYSDQTRAEINFESSIFRGKESLDPIIGIETDKWRLYLSRAWCRMELYLAAAVPVADTKVLVRGDIVDRTECFSLGLQNAVRAGRRPHFLAENIDECPIVLAPMLHSYKETFSPAKGELTKKEDMPKICAFMEAFETKRAKEGGGPVYGYEGERNAKGEKHGQGKELFENGDLFEGRFEHDVHIEGAMHFATGNVFKGNYNRKGEREGQGSMVYLVDGKFEGIYEANEMKHGVREYGDGTVYEGYFVRGMRHGEGELYFYDDDIGKRVIFKGVWRHDKPMYIEECNAEPVKSRPLTTAKGGCCTLS